jgi:hypothetical protein
MSDTIKLCVVCGARTYLNTTCDAVCGKAKRAGITRIQQIEIDMKEPDPLAGTGMNYCHICGCNYHGEICMVCEEAD